MKYTISWVDSIEGQISNINEVHTNYMKQIAFGKYSGVSHDTPLIP